MALSSARIPTVVEAIAYPDRVEKLTALIDALEGEEIPYVVIGGMSNVLFKDNIYRGVVVKTTKIRSKIKAESRIVLSCGDRIARVAFELAECDLGGFEGLVGIPGTVGGMVRQNAGAFGYEISDRFVEASCYIPATRAVRKYTRSEMRFSYRDSAINADGAILLSATFDAAYKEQADILSEIETYRSRRLATQPTDLPSLGSIFKRHDGVSAGFYIDKAGLKGYSIGGARISEKHAGFIVNVGGASAEDYLKLINYVKERGYSVFGIVLREEIEIVR